MARRYYISKLIDADPLSDHPLLRSIHPEAMEHPGVSVFATAIPPHTKDGGGKDNGRYGTDFCLVEVHADTDEQFAEVEKSGASILVADLDAKESPIDVKHHALLTARLVEAGIAVTVDGVKSARAFIDEVAVILNPDNPKPFDPPKEAKARVLVDANTGVVTEAP